MRRLSTIAVVAFLACILRADDGPLDVPYPPRDAQRALPLPVLSSYQPDNGGTSDPVGQASRALATGNAPEVKLSPAPYERVVVPDPFENRNLVKPRPPIPEEPVPPMLLKKK